MLKRFLKASALPTSKSHGLSSTERSRHSDAKLRKHMYQAVISFLSNYPTGFRIVTGLFILFIPFLQLKGRDLRVCDFYLSFLFKYFFAAPYMIVIVCSATPSIQPKFLTDSILFI